MRSRAGQRVPVWLQTIVVVVCATAMVIAADAEDYCGETPQSASRLSARVDRLVRVPSRADPEADVPHALAIFSVLQQLTQRTDGACDGRSRRIAWIRLADSICWNAVNWGME